MNLKISEQRNNLISHAPPTYADSFVSCRHHTLHPCLPPGVHSFSAVMNHRHMGGGGSSEEGREQGDTQYKGRYSHKSSGVLKMQLCVVTPFFY